MAFIYKITNNINGKFYIGFTSQKNPKLRFNQHLSSARSKKSNNQPIIRAIKKYGEDNFSFDILLEGDEDFLLKKEEPRLIEELKPEYNATFGGEGILGYKHTEKTKEIIKNLHIGKKESEEHKNWRSMRIREGWENVSLDEKVNYAKNYLEKNSPQRVENSSTSWEGVIIIRISNNNNPPVTPKLNISLPYVDGNCCLVQK